MESSPKNFCFELFCAKNSNSHYDFNYGSSESRITPENILSVVVKLPENEFKNLFSNAKKMCRNKSENELIKKLS